MDQLQHEQVRLRGKDKTREKIKYKVISPLNASIIATAMRLLTQQQAVTVI